MIRFWEKVRLRLGEVLFEGSVLVLEFGRLGFKVILFLRSYVIIFFVGVLIF